MTSQHERYLGMRPGDLAGKPYAAFWNPRLAPLSEHARQALAHGPVAAPVLPALTDAPRLLEPGPEGLENGYALGSDGVLRVAVRTELPGASPAMVDWWFGWHSAEPQRYKLWHPHAHVYAAWGSAGPAGARGRDRYVGRVSWVDEYLGGDLGRYAIRFLPPRELGLDEQALADPREATAVCARVGWADYPLDFGYLLHHVRRVAGGAEMRSRFWVGGPLAGPRRGGLAARSLVRLVRLVMKPRLAHGHALLGHCAQEMAHLASFLPRIYAACQDVP